MQDKYFYSMNKKWVVNNTASKEKDTLMVNQLKAQNFIL